MMLIYIYIERDINCSFANVCLYTPLQPPTSNSDEIKKWEIRKSMEFTLIYISP